MLARWSLAVIILALLGAVVIWPLLELVAVAVGQTPALGAGTGAAIRHSLLVAAAVATLATVGGLAAALLTERGNIAGRRWLRIGIVLPLLIPPFVSALAWTRAYGPSGLTDDVLGWSFPGLYGPIGIVTVIVQSALPVGYLIMVGTLHSGATRDLERAARVAGASGGVAFRTVTLPSLGPALGGVGLLTAMMALNAFGVPALLGTPARFETVTTLIYQDLARSAQPESFRRAVFLACGLVVVALALTLTSEALLGQEGRRTVEAAGPVVARPRRRVWGVWTLVAAVVGVPLIALVLISLTKAVGLAPVPANWTMRNFTEAITGRFVGALWRSLLLAVAAATLAVILGGLVVMVKDRRWVGRSRILVGLAFAVPGSTLAVAVLLAYGPSLRDTLGLILIAYVAKVWAIGHRSLAGAAAGLDRELTWAARSGGAGPLATFTTVALPLLRPGIAAGFVLAFLFAFHELTMSALLYGPGTDTLAVVILNLQQIGDVGVSSALAVILTLPLLALAIPLLAKRRWSPQGLGGG